MVAPAGPRFTRVAGASEKLTTCSTTVNTFLPTNTDGEKAAAQACATGRRSEAAQARSRARIRRAEDGRDPSQAGASRHLALCTADVGGLGRDLRRHIFLALSFQLARCGQFDGG